MPVDWYDNPQSPPELDLDYLELAVRYALGLPGVATVNLGVHNMDQVRQNVEMVKRFKPLTDGEQIQVATLWQMLAKQWGEHFGPVA